MVGSGLALNSRSRWESLLTSIRVAPLFFARAASSPVSTGGRKGLSSRSCRPASGGAQPEMRIALATSQMPRIATIGPMMAHNVTPVITLPEMMPRP